MKKLLLILLLLAKNFSGFSQQPIFATNYDGDLYSIDLQNCTSEFRGTTGHWFGDIAFTPDGRLWGLSDGDLYQIDTTTGMSTFIGSSSVSGVTLVGLNDSTLLAEVQQNLYGIRNTDASSYYIGNIGFTSAGDLTWYNKNLYMTGLGLLIKIVLTDNDSAIISSSSLNNTIPYCEGAIAATLFDSSDVIIGFSGADAYRICPLDGANEIYCPSLIPSGAMGGASIPLLVQVPEPSCGIATFMWYRNLLFITHAHKQHHFPKSCYHFLHRHLRSNTCHTTYYHEYVRR